MVRVFFLPGLVDPAALASRRVVVIDVLRATTTIVWALASGAREIVPFEEVAEARRMAAVGGDAVLLGGERQGKKIDGFDLGNSPAEYTVERVSGKSIYFTTTNGTRAMQACREAAEIWIGAFANLDALCERLAGTTDWDVVCAGTDGQITREDVLLAGALVSRVVWGERSLGVPHSERSGSDHSGGLGSLDPRTRDSEELSEDSLSRSGSKNSQLAGVPTGELNDQARMAAELWRSVVGPSRLTTARLSQLLQDSHGGRNLLEIGQGDDIARAAQWNRFPLIAELNSQSWRIQRV